MKILGIPVRSGWLWFTAIGVVAILVLTTQSRWRLRTQAWVQATISGNRIPSTLEGQDKKGEADNRDHSHDPGNSRSLELSKQAQGNIGLTAAFLQPVTLETFQRTITIPGIIVDRPGRTRVEISTPMAGVITHVHAVQGEAVRQGTLLFELRITAEELVSTQTNLLQSVGDLDVENREIARLAKASESGAVSQKTLLERQYAKEKLEVLMNAQREALRLHGLSERQIDDITVNRRLLRDLKIVAPGPDAHGSEELKLSRMDVRLQSQFQLSGLEAATSRARDSVLRDARDSQPVDGLGSLFVSHNTRPEQAHSELLVAATAPLILQEVMVHKGETVRAGATLAVLADYSELYIEGRAFEQDAELFSACSERGWKIAAAFDTSGHQSVRIEDLDLVYSASEVDPESRSLSFFVRLPNEIARETPSPNGQRYLDWKYRPGRRLQLLVPVEEWADQIVLPVEAIAREGAESCVFQQNGAHFDRIPVQLKYRDAAHVVVANDGSIFPGDVIALRGAHQMQMALKNKSGGAADPHAGHNH